LDKVERATRLGGKDEFFHVGAKCSVFLEVEQKYNCHPGILKECPGSSHKKYIF